MKKHEKRTIGDWLPELAGVEVTAKPFWTIARDHRGTHAVVIVNALLKRDGTVIGMAKLGVAARGADFPHNERWLPGSMSTREAIRLVTDVASSTALDEIPYRAFWGVNCALPWEVLQPPEPPKPSIWHRFIAWITFWKGGVA